MKKLLKIIIIIAVLAGVALGVKSIFFDGNTTSQVGALISSKVVTDTIKTTISAKINVDFNSKVKKGQIIAELDKSKLQSTLKQATISYKSAENDLNYKQSTYDRIKKLAASKSASAVELEQAEYNLNAAKLSLEQRKNEVAQARLNLSYATIKSPIDGVVLKRAVDVGQTVAASMSTPTLFVIAKDLSQMKVMADVDEADIGQVKQGQRVTFTVDAFQNDTFHGTVQEVRLNPTTTSNVVTYTVVITAENPEQKLLPGMTATCTIVTQEITDAITIPVKALKFTPAAGTPMMDPKDMPRPERPKTAEAGDNFPPPPPGMGPGGAPSTGAKKKHKKPKLEGDHVWININGKAAPRRVKIGLSDGVNVQILKGLSVGDSVVTSQETVSAKGSSEPNAKSPFMPQRPGKKKK